MGDVVKTFPCIFSSSLMIGHWFTTGAICAVLERHFWRKWHSMSTVRNKKCIVFTGFFCQLTSTFITTWSSFLLSSTFLFSIVYMCAQVHICTCPLVCPLFTITHYIDTYTDVKYLCFSPCTSTSVWNDHTVTGLL